LIIFSVFQNSTFQKWPKNRFFQKKRVFLWFLSFYKNVRKTENHTFFIFM
jgi:hypothetical protein